MNDSKNTFFIGTTRFSLFIPGSGSWNLSSKANSEEEYKKNLFSSERLDVRIKIFTEISLPQLAIAAKNYNLLHIVQYSSHLPQKYIQTLKEAENKYSFLKLFCSDQLSQHAEFVNEQVSRFSSNFPENKVTYAWYRLDDDDLISVNFFNYALPFISKHNIGYCLSFGRGYTATYHDNQIWDFRECYRPKTSVGQIYICQFDKETGLIVEAPRQNHAQIDKWAPTILDSRLPNFITLLHPNQDGHSRGEKDSAILKIYQEQSLSPYIEYDDSLLIENFPSIRPHTQKIREDFLDARKNSSINPIQIKTSPTKFELNKNFSSLEISYEILAGAPDSHSRIFFALVFESSIADEEIKKQNQWVVFENNKLVTGIPLNSGKKLGRLFFTSSTLPKPARLEIWHSKQVAGPVSISYLSTNMS